MASLSFSLSFPQEWSKSRRAWARVYFDISFAFAGKTFCCAKGARDRNRAGEGSRGWRTT